MSCEGLSPPLPPPLPPRSSTTSCEGLGTRCCPTALLWLGPTRTMVAPKNPALHNLSSLSVHMASGMPHPLVVEVHQHTCLLVRQLLTSSHHSLPLAPHLRRSSCSLGSPGPPGPAGAASLLKMEGGVAP